MPAPWRSTFVPFRGPPHESRAPSPTPTSSGFSLRPRYRCLQRRAQPRNHGSKRNLVSTPERRPELGGAICKLSLLGEAEAGSAGTQPCQGITWWAHRDDENEARSFSSAPRVLSHRTIDPHALENPGGLGAGPQIKKSQQYLVGFLRLSQQWSSGEVENRAKSPMLRVVRIDDRRL